MEDNLLFIEGYVAKYLDNNFGKMSSELEIQLKYLKSRNLKYFSSVVIYDDIYIIHINEMECKLEFKPDKDFLRYVRKMKLKRVKNG